MIKVKVSNKITIENPDAVIVKAVSTALTIDNPAYWKNQRMGLHVWEGMRTFRYYQVTPDNTLIVPRGFRKRLLSWLGKMGYEYEVEEELVRNENSATSTISLRENQVGITEEALKEKECIIWADTAIGKTIVSIEIIARLGLTATIIVKNTMLLTQFRDEIKKFLGVDIGIVGNGKKDIKPITVATIQSLSADENTLRLLASNTSILIADECHEMVTPKRLKILEKFRPTHLYGLSATVRREDARSVNFIFGECTNFVEGVKMRPTVDVVRFSDHIPVDDYHQIIEKMAENENRNTLIHGIGLGEAMSGRKVLILTKRRAHAQLLYDKFDSEWQNNAVFLIDSTDKNRNALISQFKSNERDFSVLIGTTSLLAVGTDVPSLDTLIIACDLKSEVLATQSCGRVLRLFEGKPDPKIIDIADYGNPILKRQFYSRLSLYKRKSWNIKGL